VRYRFYVSTALRGRRHKAGSLTRISAPGIEGLVEGEVRKRLPLVDSTTEEVFDKILRVVVSTGQIEITLENSHNNKRPIEIPWTPKPKNEAPVQLSPTNTTTDNKLIKAIARARAWLDDLAAGRFTSVGDLAIVANLNPKVIRQGLRLAFLAPELTTAVLDGEARFALKQIPKLLPLSWHEQSQTIA
jgi:site-specific DNA recombinase